MRFDGKDGYVECAPTPSLDIKYTGTLEVWYKAVTVQARQTQGGQARQTSGGQGGLVCRTTGGGWEDARLVFGFNTYRKANTLMWAMADGNVYRHAGSAAPPVNQWTHAALTYDGGLVKLFLDGLLVDAGRGILQEVIPRVITPEIADVPLWVGRVMGIGEQYFKGLMSEVRVYNHALSEQEIFAHFKAKAGAHGKTKRGPPELKMVVHKYPGYGLLSARVDFRRLWPIPAGRGISVTLHRPGTRDFLMRRVTDKLPDYGQLRFVFRLPGLPPGKYQLRATCGGPEAHPVCKDAMATVEWPKTPDWLRDRNIKMLNNLVFELLNTQKAAAQYSFYNFRKGFVFISTSATGNAEVYVGAEKQPAIRHGHGKPNPQEAMRYLAEGRHVIRVVGGRLEHLIVRAVPQLISHHPAGPHVTEFGKYDKPFVYKYLINSLNANISGHDYGPKHPFPAEQWAPPWVATGRKWYTHTGMPGYRELRGENRTISAKDAYEYWAKNRAYANPVFAGFFADEVGADNHPINDSWRQAALMLKADPKFKGKRLFVYTTSMYPFERALEYSKTLAECGYANAWKRYLHESPDRLSAERSIYAYFDQEMQNWREKQPGVEKAMAVVPACFSAPPESVDVYPQANFKVFMDMELNCLANAPAFVGLDTIEEYLVSYSCEETVRWIGRIFRHYGIEGKTELLSTDPYELTHIRNGDFIRQGEGWTLKPAETDTIRFRKIKGYGWFQGRYPGRFDLGDFVLSTKRSAKASNVFSQEIRNLEPGRLYSFRMYTADAGELAAGKSSKQTYAMSITLEGVEDLKDRGFQHVFGNCHNMGPFKKRNACWMNFHWRIFRAMGPTAQLIVSDWKDAHAPGGPIGQELVHNFVQVQPYLDKGEGVKG